MPAKHAKDREKGTGGRRSTVAGKTPCFYILALILISLALLASCGKEAGLIGEEKAKEAAAQALIGKPGFEGNVPVTVTLADGKYTVTFTFSKPGGKPGETYHSRAVVDGRTGEALSIEVGE